MALRRPGVRIPLGPLYKASARVLFLFTSIASGGLGARRAARIIRAHSACSPLSGGVGARLNGIEKALPITWGLRTVRIPLGPLQEASNPSLRDPLPHSLETKTGQIGKGSWQSACVLILKLSLILFDILVMRQLAF